MVFQQVLHVGQVHRAVLVQIRHLRDFNPAGGLFAARAVLERLDFEQRQLPISHRGFGIAGGDELLQAQVIEVHREILEKVALIGVVAVAQNHLIAEVFLVVAQFRLNIRHLCVKLVSFVLLGFIQVSCRHPAPRSCFASVIMEYSYCNQFRPLVGLFTAANL